MSESGGAVGGQVEAGSERAGSRGLAMTRPQKSLARKECGMCGQKLEHAAQGRCGSMFPGLTECFWVPAIYEFGPEGALALSRTEGERRRETTA